MLGRAELGCLRCMWGWLTRSLQPTVCCMWGWLTRSLQPTACCMGGRHLLRTGTVWDSSCPASSSRLRQQASRAASSTSSSYGMVGSMCRCSGLSSWDQGLGFSI